MNCSLRRTESNNHICVCLSQLQLLPVTLFLCCKCWLNQIFPYFIAVIPAWYKWSGWHWVLTASCFWLQCHSPVILVGIGCGDRNCFAIPSVVSGPSWRKSAAGAAQNSWIQIHFASIDAAQADILQVWSNHEAKKPNNCGLLPLHVMWLPSKREMEAAEGTNPRLPWDTMATGPSQGQQEMGPGRFEIKIALNDLLFAECLLTTWWSQGQFQMFSV